MNTIGGVMSGNRSTRSCAYEKMPSTHRATITIVANTGLAIETRVNHMRVLLRLSIAPARQDREVADAGFDAVGAERCATTFAGAPSFRFSNRIASTIV